MRVQVNSDNTVVVDAGVKRFAKDEVDRILANFTDRLTRVEIHFSDVNSLRSGPSDKRCLIEARPAGDTPRTASATADAVPAALIQALRKMRRSLTSFFGRKGHAARAAAPKARATSTREPAAPKVVPAKASRAAKATSSATPKGKGRATKATASAEPTGRGPKKKGVFLARRKSWPSR